MFEEVTVSDFIENATLRANSCTIQHFLFYVEELLHPTNGLVLCSMVIYFLLFSVWMTYEWILIIFLTHYLVMYSGLLGQISLAWLDAWTFESFSIVGFLNILGLIC